MTGSFIQAASGFGYAIFCMALWPLFLPFRVASVLESITAFFMVIYITFYLRKYINFKLMIAPIFSSMLFSTLGVFTLLSSTESLMRRILGAALMILAIYFVFWSDKIHLKPTLFNGIVAGAVSGFFGGLFNIGGPPMVAYFLSVTDDKMEYNATLQCYFCITTLYIFLNHFLLGNVNITILSYSGVALMGVILGTWLGLTFFKKLSMRNIKRLVYSFMAVAGLYLVFVG